MKHLLSFLVASVVTLAAVRLGPAIAGVVLHPGSHGAWYASRAAGVASYLFLWLGLVGGLLMSSAWFDGLVGRARLLAFHQAASITGVVLGFSHALVLIPDQWTQFGLVDLFVPYASYYKPTLTGVGTVSLYLALIVSASFWFRRAIGMRMWRIIHYMSVVAFAGALWHGVQMGTDSREPWLLGTYLGTSLFIVFGVIVRLTYIRPRPQRQPARESVSV
ncbi:MAG: ferric reductase-like transmembrane domain-containing protein [Anaerolineaceae bacterium]